MIVVGYIPATLTALFTEVLIPQLLPLLDVWNQILQQQVEKEHFQVCAFVNEPK